MSYNYQLVEQSSQPVLSVRKKTTVADLPQLLGDIYGSIMQYLSENGECPSDAPFAVFYNMDMEDLDVEAGFPVSKRLEGKNDITASQIPPGKYASCLNIGPYRQAASAYNALLEWIRENGYTATGIAYEFYLNDPSKTPEAELQTKIMLPLE